MNRMKKSIVLVIVAFIFSNNVLACNNKQIVERQTEYHQEILDYERSLLNTYGDFYCIEEPHINHENKFIQINIVFLTSYIEDTSKDLTILEIMEGTRIASNVFLEENPDFFLNDDYAIYIYFFEYPELYSLGPIKWGYMCNVITDSNSIESSICHVEYSEIASQYISNSISFEGIKQINLGHLSQNEVVDVVNLLNKMPDLETVIVQPEEIRDELTRIFPNINIMSY